MIQPLTNTELQKIPNTMTTLTNSSGGLLADDRLEIDILKQKLDSLQQHREAREYKDVVDLADSIKRDADALVTSCRDHVAKSLFQTGVQEIKEILNSRIALIRLLNYEANCLASGKKRNRTYTPRHDDIVLILNVMFEALITLNGTSSLINMLFDKADCLAGCNKYAMLMEPDPWLIKQLEKYARDDVDNAIVAKALLHYKNASDSPRIAAILDTEIRRALITNDWREIEAQQTKGLMS